MLAYLNRLSDALFVMARYENQQRGVSEPLWQPGAELVRGVERPVGRHSVDDVDGRP